MISSGLPGKCPRCGSTRIFPSRLRSLLERIRRAFTEKEPYRCRACRFRAWYPMAVPVARGPDAGPDELRTGTAAPPVTADDLDRLDKN
jgi:hypothetical protein